MQLTPWAEKTFTTEGLVREARKLTKTRSLEVFYPVTEDETGKFPSPYSEYLFVRLTDNLDFSVFEEGEIFKSVLREVSGRLQTVADAEVSSIRDQIRKKAVLNCGDRVKIIKGPLRGNLGSVWTANDTTVLISVNMGGEHFEAALDARHVRRVSKKRGRSQQVKIVRRGPKNSRVHIQGEAESILVPNEELRSLLNRGSWILEE